jgi:hypothetical protein
MDDGRWAARRFNGRRSVHLAALNKASTYGWAPLAVMDVAKVREIKSQHSGLWRFLLGYMFTKQSANFARGVAVPRPLPGSGNMLLRGKIHFAVQDADSLRAALRWKGAAGSCCCLFCRSAYKGALLAPDAPGAQGGVFHYRYAQPHQFDLHTDQTVWDTVDYLEQKPEGA